MTAIAAALRLTTPVAARSNAELVSLSGIEQLDAGTLSRLVRTHGSLARQGRKLHVVDAAPEVARMLETLGLRWMLANLPAANEPMRRAA